MIKQTSHALFGTFGTNVLILFTSFITGILLARLLQPEGRGALAVVLFWPHFIAGIGIISVNEAVTYRTSRATSEFSNIVSSGFWLALFLSLITSLFAILLLPHVFGAERIDLLPLSQIYLLFFIPFNFLYLTLISADLGRFSFKRYNLLRLIQPLIYLVGLMSLWFVEGITVRKVVYIVLLGTVVSAVIKIVQDVQQLRVKPSLSEIKKIIKTGFNFHITNLLIFANTEMDRLIVITMLDNNKVGIYVVALAIASAGLGLISQTFRTVIFPYLSKSVNKTEQRNLIAESLKSVMLLLVITTLVLIISSPWMIPLLFGQAFQKSVTPAIILLVAFIPKALRNVIIYNLRGLGKVKPGTYAEIVALLVFSICVLPLINNYELIGAGLALMISNVISLSYLSVYLYKYLDLSPLQWWGLNVSTMKKVIYASQAILNSR